MLRFVFFVALLPLSLFPNALKEKESCPEGKEPYRATLRHIESGGIGYEVGYTTLEAFFASDPSRWSVTPFVDARGHIFDNGKWAANLGAGLRGVWKNRAYGINTYYDYRNAGRFHSNQISLGLETLGEFFDFSINGYLPVGRKTSSPYEPLFDSFSGHQMLISEKYQSAMKGANAEFGFHFGKWKSFDFYASAGPYYFIGEVAPCIWGGKAKISGTFKDLLTLEISDSYDRTFHNKFQGQIALTFSFGPKSASKEPQRDCQGTVLHNRMLQQTNRQEIIVIDHPRKKNIAINPATGLPYFFVFVDNTSHSEGTYESPYHTLLQAQNNSAPNDIIYVFPGNGTTTGMNSGIFLKPNQKFWGSGVNHLLQTAQGTISIPAQTNTSPTITNTNIDTEGNAITLATSNAVSGFKISSAMNDAIYGVDLQNLEVSSCTFENTITYPIQASFSNSGNISITNNEFLNNTNGISLVLDETSTITCSNNTFQGQTSVSSKPLEIIANSNPFTAQIQNNTFNENRTGGIYFSLNSVIDANISLLHNTITDNDSGFADTLGSSFVIECIGTSNRCSVVLEENTFLRNTKNAVYLHTSGEVTTLNFTASRNTISDNGKSGFSIQTPANTLTFLATDNIITRSSDHGISIAAPSVTSNGNITINNNTITDIEGGANGIVVNQSFTTVHLTISNNEIKRCEGTGIVSFPGTIDSLTVNILDNTVSDCLNNSNAASGICFDNYLDATVTMTRNTLLNNTVPAVAFGLISTGNPNICLNLAQNVCNTDLMDPSYSLNNPGMGTFYLSPCDAETVNTGTINAIGMIDSAPSCSNLSPCPPLLQPFKNP